MLTSMLHLESLNVMLIDKDVKSMNQILPLLFSMSLWFRWEQKSKFDLIDFRGGEDVIYANYRWIISLNAHAMFCV